MQPIRRDRRGVLWGLSALAGAGILGASTTPATAQQVKYSSGTEPSKLKVPANACDCHHHIYGSQYKVDPRSTLRPGDATVDDYRALQKRISTTRNVIVQPSTYGTDNAPTLDALVAFGPSARAVVVVDTTVTDAELKRMHGRGARGVRFNLAQAGATTPEMIEPLSKRVNELGWHIQINAPAAKIMEIMPILEKVPSPIVFDHLAHFPRRTGSVIRCLPRSARCLTRARPGCPAPMPTPKLGRRLTLLKRDRPRLRQGGAGAARLAQRQATPGRARSPTQAGRCDPDRFDARLGARRGGTEPHHRR